GLRLVIDSANMDGDVEAGVGGGGDQRAPDPLGAAGDQGRAPLSHGSAFRSASVQPAEFEEIQRADHDEEDDDDADAEHVPFPKISLPPHLAMGRELSNSQPGSACPPPTRTSPSLRH